MASTTAEKVELLAARFVEKSDLERGARRRFGHIDPKKLADPLIAAKTAHLRYVGDHDAGIRRERAGKDFRYVAPNGRPISDKKTLLRIRSLVIPPAWTDVWICPLEDGHLQATGRDARKRKQYRYHPRWREVRDDAKYGRMVAFGTALPRIRRRVGDDLKLPGLPHAKVLATLVRLLETTLIRVGNEEYARQNGSYGLTTLRDQHAKIEGSTIHFHFRGKSGKVHNIDLRDPRLARLVKRCQEIPGHELFQYFDADGRRHAVGSADVNEYLHGIVGQDFTAKDFRTWAGTILAARNLVEYGPSRTLNEARKRIVQVIHCVAERLGNTIAVCRKCYVHPMVLESYVNGTLIEGFQIRVTRTVTHGLQNDETALLKFLKKINGGELK